MWAGTGVGKSIGSGQVQVWSETCVEKVQMWSKYRFEQVWI